MRRSRDVEETDEMQVLLKKINDEPFINNLLG